VVAARQTDDCPIGSRNFVLLRHNLTVGATPIEFWTLFFHLDAESPGPDAPAWYLRAQSQLGDDAVSLSIEVSAGELIGHVGEAGPPGRLEGQVHVEVMSADEIGEKIDPGFWHTVEGAGMGRFCDAPEIVDKIDKPVDGKKDGVLSRLEVLNFFRQDPARASFHKLAVHHVSEWADQNDWQVALNRVKDFADLPSEQRQRLYRDQIAPVLWWTDDIGDAAGLPSDKVVWNYHPITFIVWLHEELKGASSTAKGIGAASDFQGQAAPTNITDDADATDGFTDDEDTFFESNKKLNLEDLANGYPDDGKKK
jgi:hypothetical protein